MLRRLSRSRPAFQALQITTSILDAPRGEQQQSIPAATGRYGSEDCPTRATTVVSPMETWPIGVRNDHPNGAALDPARPEQPHDGHHTGGAVFDPSARHAKPPPDGCNRAQQPKNDESPQRFTYAHTRDCDAKGGGRRSADTIAHSPKEVWLEVGTAGSFAHRTLESSWQNTLVSASGAGSLSIAKQPDQPISRAGPRHPAQQECGSSRGVATQARPTAHRSSTALRGVAPSFVAFSRCCCNLLRRSWETLRVLGDS